MLLVLCVDLDDDLGRKTGIETPVIGRDAVEDAGVALATADPEDSDGNVIFEGLHLYDELSGEETVEVAVVTGTAANDVTAARTVGEEVDRVLASLRTAEDVQAVVVTDGAQDESVLPVIRSRVPIDSVRRVVVRQAQDLESMYYTMKQVLNDPETRSTILVPLGILLLVYPAAILVDALQLPVPGSAFGIVSALLGLYLLFRGLGLEETVDESVERVRVALYTGRLTLITSVVALALLAVGVAGGQAQLQARGPALAPTRTVAAFVYGATGWAAAGGVVASFGRITDEYLADSFRWRYLNAPFYVAAIAVVVHALSAFFLVEPVASLDPLTYLAAALAGGTLLAVTSTLTFAVAETRFAREGERGGAAG